MYYRFEILDLIKNFFDIESSISRTAFLFWFFESCWSPKRVGLWSTMYSVILFLFANFSMHFFHNSRTFATRFSDIHSKTKLFRIFYLCIRFQIYHDIKTLMRQSHWQIKLIWIMSCFSIFAVIIKYLFSACQMYKNDVNKYVASSIAISFMMYIW